MADDPPDNDGNDPPDGGVPDGGAPDGGAPDGGAPDGGAPDDGGSAPGGAPPPADPSGGQDDGGTGGGGAPGTSAPPDTGPVVTNSVSTSPENPVVRPRVRNIRQYDSPWGSLSVRRDGQRNITDQVTSQDSWTGNGCFPTAMTIVMNWWYMYHGPTQGQLTFPHGASWTGGAGSDLLPPQLCEMTGGDTYADCYGAAISDEDYTKWKYNNPAHVDYRVSAQNVITGITGTTAPAGSATPNMTRVRISLTGSADDKATQIKQYLHYGPVMVMISYPGHWVVIDAYVGNNIYICDPGAVMASGGKFYAMGGTAVPEGDLPAGATTGQAYYIIDATATLTSKNGKQKFKWLDKVPTMDVIYVPDPDATGSDGHPKPFYPHQDFDIQAPMSQDDVSGAASSATPSSDPSTPQNTPDGGTPDGGTPDGSTPDGGSPDGGSADPSNDGTDQ